jgi:hypothetical protein
LNIDRLLFVSGALITGGACSSILDAAGIKQLVDTAALVVTEIESRATTDTQHEKHQQALRENAEKFLREAPLRQKLADRGKGIYVPND